MENIEQLKQYNAKLTERLNNAAKFFKEQKAQIEALTDEVKEKTSLVMDYRNQIEDLTKEKKELENKFKEQQDFEANNINKVVPELEEKLKNAEASNAASKIEIENLHAQLIKSNEDLQKRIDQIRATEKTYDEEQKKIINARDEFIMKYRDLENQYKELETKYNECEKELNNIKENNEKLNKLYDDLENQKLGLECDFNNLEEKYNNIKLQNDTNVKYEKYITDTILKIWTACDDIINPKPIEKEVKETLEKKESTIKINSQENLPNKEEHPRHEFMKEALINI